MRVTFTSQGRSTVEHLHGVQARKQRAANEVSSGLRVTKPSDSPADAAGIIRTRRDLAQLQQFRSNLEATQAELQAIDAAMFEAGSVLNRALSLATQAANSTQDAETRDLIRAEVGAIFRHMVSIANTAHSNRYVFAGNLDDSLPFLSDSSSADGVIYVGDAQNRSLTFPDGRPAQISLPGDEVFLTPDAFSGA
jgi:flagellar hook-associated protein 3 FlgL